MSYKDWLELSLSILTLATTVYFTFQLVRNDNNRAKRDQEDRLLLQFKNRLLPAASQPGVLQLVGSNLGSNNPTKKNLFFEAFEELYYDIMAQHGTGPSVTPQKFRELMEMYEPGKWD